MEKSRGYTADQLFEFVNKHAFRFQKSEPDPELCHAAACALMDALSHGINLRKELGLDKKRGQRGPKFDIDKLPIGHPIIQATCRYILGIVGYTDTVSEIASTANVDERTAKDYLLAAKPKAENFLQFMSWMASRKGSEK